MSSRQSGINRERLSSSQKEQTIKAEQECLQDFYECTTRKPPINFSIATTKSIQEVYTETEKCP